MNDIDGNTFGRQFDERVAEGLHRTVHITFDHNVKFLIIAEFEATTNLVESKHFGSTQVLFTLELHAFVCNVASFLFGFHYVELVAGLWCSIEAEYCSSMGWRHFLNADSAFVE